MAKRKPNKTKPTKPTTTKTKNNFTLDRKTGRWRNNGRFSPAPKKSQLRKDSKGRPLDSLGKRVPMAAIAPAKPPKKAPRGKVPAAPTKRKPPPPKAPRKPRAPVKRPAPAPRPPKAPKPRPAPRPSKPAPAPKRRSAGNVEYIADGEALTERRLLSSTFENQAAPVHAGEILQKIVQRRAARFGRFSDDLPIYRYGVAFTNTKESGNESRTADLVEKLASEYPHYSFQYNANNVNITLGGKDEPVFVKDAKRDLTNSAEELEDIWGYLQDLWDDDLGWFAIAENDEHTGKSD
jgi:hypothetical protein